MYMNKITGKFAEAIVYTDDIEDYAKAQIQLICDNEVSKGSDIRIMPDVHPGKVGTIGLTMTLGDRIIPNLLGVDIGCGLLMANVRTKGLEFQKLDKVIRENVPSGFSIRKTPHLMAEDIDLTKLYCYKHINQDKALRSLGTLGGGNHFIEVDKGDSGNYVVIHTGSRHLGMEITEYYIRQGQEELKKMDEDVPYELTWLEGELKNQYLHDVRVGQEYAELNRKIIMREILKGMKWKEKDRWESVHNYIDELSDGRLILRKGAISARENQPVIIPINMRDGVIIGTGKGNVDWNESAPHGSGRKYKREDVKKQFTVSSFKSEMKGIYSTCIGEDTLDEAPFAYRSIEDIMDNIRDTVEVAEVIKPVYNYKAGDKK